MVEGSKVHSKGGKEVRLENALPKVVNGPKAHLKRGRVGNALPERWWLKGAQKGKRGL